MPEIAWMNMLRVIKFFKCIIYRNDSLPPTERMHKNEEGMNLLKIVCSNSHLINSAINMTRNLWWFKFSDII